MILYRPVGLEELLLIFDAGMRAFPPRLPDQPIFYPVLNEPYAVQIARDWNTKRDSLAGYVTRFSIGDDHARSFRVETVGARQHQELWVPAEELEAFNRALEEPIAVVGGYFGDGFRGVVADGASLRGKDAVAQLVALSDLHDHSLVDLHGEIAANPRAVFAHVPFWDRRSFAADGVSDARRQTVLIAIRAAWSSAFPDILLPPP